MSSLLPAIKSLLARVRSACLIRCAFTFLVAYVPHALRLNKRGLLALLSLALAAGLSSGAQAQTAPAWGYETWGNTYNFGGSCASGQTKTYSGPTKDDVATQVIEYARTCAAATYNYATCSSPSVTTPVENITSVCNFTGTYPGGFEVKLICSPGKMLTPASPNACVPWSLATVSVNVPANGTTLLVPASLVAEVTVANLDGTVAWVNLQTNGVHAGGATYNAATGKWTLNFASIPVGTYVFTAIAGDNNGNTVTSAPATVFVSPRAVATMPAWGYDTWGISTAIGGSCNNTFLFSGATIDGTAANVMTAVRGCAPWATYNDAVCSHPSIAVPVGGISSYCAFTGDYPSNFTLNLICAPGKSLTPASPNTCVSWPLATLALTAPVDGAGYKAPATITVEAQVTNQNGTVTWVDLQNNGGSPQPASYDAATGKWSATFTGLPVGSYSIAAAAGDLGGHAVTSEPVSVTVLPNLPPTASIDPVVGVFKAPARVVLTGSASDPENGLQLAQFYRDGQFLANPIPLGSNAYRYEWLNVPAGTYSIDFRAVDNVNNGAISTPVTIVVQPHSPDVSVAAPTVGSTLIAPATVILGASATDNVDAISSVNFYAGGTLIGAGTSNGLNAYTTSYTFSTPGTYTITAVATDSGGISITSAPVTYTVYPSNPPSVAIASPSTNTKYPVGATIPLRVQAADTDGTITQVQIYAGASPIGTAALLYGSTADGTYAFNWSGAASGSYTVTAVATDNTGLAVTSSPITIAVGGSASASVSVNGPPPGTTFAAPANIQLSAAVSSAASPVSQVEFFSNAALIGSGSLSSGTASSGSYVTNAWTNVPAGTYAITASATDESGTTTFSTPITFTVGAASSGANTTLYFINADHLGTPRLIENQSQQAVWKWEQGEAFGDSVPDQNPVGAGEFVSNLRFVGQYFDQETNTNYNNARDYNANSGRYVQSDPIGFGGGINTYAYVNANPIAATDPTGLFDPRGFAVGVGIASTVPAWVFPASVVAVYIGGGLIISSVDPGPTDQYTHHGWGENEDRSTPDHDDERMALAYTGAENCEQLLWALATLKAAIEDRTGDMVTHARDRNNMRGKGHRTRKSILKEKFDRLEPIYILRCTCSK